MAERCERADEIDLMSYVDDPDSPEWQEFRYHERECPICSATVQEWASIAATLRQPGRELREPHPNESDLVDYHRQPDRLPLEVRSSIEEHLQKCSACKTDLDFVDSFKFSFPKLNEAEAAPEKTRPIQATPLASKESAVARFFRPLRWVALQPAFAYGLAVLLTIPAFRYLTLPEAPEAGIQKPDLSVQRSSGNVETRDGVESRGTLIVQQGIIPSDAASSDPRVAAVKVLSQYKAAYEACDIKALRQVWDMGYDAEQEMTQLCGNARALALLIDVQEVTPGPSSDRVSVKFLQVLTRTNVERHIFQMPPLTYSADVARKAEAGRWIISGLRQLKSEGGG